MRVDEKPEPPTDESVALSLSMLSAVRMAGSIEDGIVTCIYKSEGEDKCLVILWQNEWFVVVAMRWKMRC